MHASASQKIKRALCVGTALTGSAVGATALTAMPAYATTNYEVNIKYSYNVTRAELCGDNQNGTWVCTPWQYSLPHPGAGINVLGIWSHTIPNWWWHGTVTLKWNIDGSKDVQARCLLPAQNTSGSWTSVWADLQTMDYNGGSGNCNNSIGD